MTESLGLTSETFSPDNLIAGDNVKVVTEGVTILSGEVLSRGALLGRITLSGKYILSLTAPSDGSEVPRAILAEDVDASLGDVDTIVYLAGEFNHEKMTFGTAHTAATTKDGLRDLNIYLKDPVKSN